MYLCFADVKKDSTWVTQSTKIKEETSLRKYLKQLKCEFKFAVNSFHCDHFFDFIKKKNLLYVIFVDYL